MNTLFTDLGEVILFYDFDAFHRELAKHSDLDENEINGVIRHWLSLCQQGKLSIKKTHENMIRDAKLKISQEEFKRLWNGFWIPNNEFMQVLEEWKLKDRKLYLISNINALSWLYIKKNFPVFKLFDDVFLSYRLRRIKPDPKVFQISLEKTGANPRESLFIDDSEANIEVAAKLGMSTWLYRKETHQALVDFLRWI